MWTALFCMKTKVRYSKEGMNRKREEHNDLHHTERVQQGVERGVVLQKAAREVSSTGYSKKGLNRKCEETGMVKGEVETERTIHLASSFFTHPVFSTPKKDELNRKV